MRFVFIIIIAIVVVTLVLYLSWQPNPQLTSVSFIPDWLGTWADDQAHDELRTGVPLFFLGLTAGLELNSFNKSWPWWLLTCLSLMMVVVIAEVGQILLPQRSFDWLDIAWGAIGSLSGILSGAAFAIILKKL